MWTHRIGAINALRFSISGVGARVDELARRVDRFAVARDAYEIFICMYIAARGFVRPHDAAPSPTLGSSSAMRFNAPPPSF